MLQLRIEALSGQFAGFFDQGEVLDEVGEFEGGQAALGTAKQIAGAAEFEIGFGDAETIGGFFHHLHALPGFVGLGVGEEDAVGIVSAATDATT